MRNVATKKNGHRRLQSYSRNLDLCFSLLLRADSLRLIYALREILKLYTAKKIWGSHYFKFKLLKCHELQWGVAPVHLVHLRRTYCLLQQYCNNVKWITAFWGTNQIRIKAPVKMHEECTFFFLHGKTVNISLQQSQMQILNFMLFIVLKSLSGVSNSSLCISLASYIFIGLKFQAAKFVINSV